MRRKNPLTVLRKVRSEVQNGLWVPLAWLSLAMFLAILTLTTSCHDAVVRDAVVYQTELNFFEKVSLDQADALQKFIAASCTCADGKFVLKDCEDAADMVVVTRARMPWHKAMARYNAGLDKTAPPKDPPAIPDPTTLCPEVTP